MEEVHAHDSQLKAYLRGAYPGMRDVDDVVQESYLRIWKARAARPIASAKAFLFQIARHLAVDAARDAHASPIDDLRDLAGVTVIEDRPTAVDDICYREKVSLVTAALARLPGRCREILILRKFEQISQRNVAAQFGISERTVESQVARGMRLIEAHLRKRGVDGFFRHET